MGHRIRVSKEEIMELRKAVLKHVGQLVDERMGTWNQFFVLRKLYYRLATVGVRGQPIRPFFPSELTDEEAMYESMTRWLKGRRRELERELTKT